MPESRHVTIYANIRPVLLIIFMVARRVRLSFPAGLRDIVRECSITIRSGSTVYDTIEVFRKDGFMRIRPVFHLMPARHVSRKVALASMINLHNADGVGRTGAIRGMVAKISAGREIVMGDGFPNIKAVRDSAGDYVVFDGHHALLAYMSAGRKHLHEVPHALVEGERGYVTLKDIRAFFGEHGNRIKRDWKSYKINWRAPKAKQLCKAKDMNMGQLMSSMRTLLYHGGE